jgi:hypothetical protein
MNIDAFGYINVGVLTLKKDLIVLPLEGSACLPSAHMTPTLPANMVQSCALPSFPMLLHNPWVILPKKACPPKVESPNPLPPDYRMLVCS